MQFLLYSKTSIMIWLLCIITAFVIFKTYQKITCKFCKSDVTLLNKVAIVTGSNTGIGYETAKNLASRGARVILACRNKDKAIAARDKIIQQTGNQNVVFKQLDLTSFSSVREFSKDILETETSLDILVNNAGTGKLDNTLTEDHLPIEMQINHFSPFLLTNLLLPKLKSSAPSRVVIVSSLMHKFGTINIQDIDKPAANFFKHSRVYSNSKLCNILFTKELSNRLKGTGVTANCLHPGAVKTDIFRDKSFLIRFLIGLIFLNCEEGAQTSVYLSVSPEVENVTGKYFSNCQEAKVSDKGQDTGLATKLWEVSERLVKL